MMATVFWDQRGVLLVEFLERGVTINADAYFKTLKKVKRDIQNKRHGILSSGIVFLYYNARLTLLDQLFTLSRNLDGMFLTIHPTAQT